MSSCSYCHHRKGKRPCPALGGVICSPCCGEHRLTRISCPADCTYLDTGSDYQQQRLGAQFAPVRRDFYQELDQLGGRKAVALFNLLEVITFGYFEGRRDGQDAGMPELHHCERSFRRKRDLDHRGVGYGNESSSISQAAVGSTGNQPGQAVDCGF